MRKNELILDKMSLPQNHPLYIAMQVYSFTEKEVHVNDLLRRVHKKRKTTENVSDEARILKAVGLLIGLGKLHYYKGWVFRDVA